jgi:hypothetical protein
MLVAPSNIGAESDWFNLKLSRFSYSLDDAD